MTAANTHSPQPKPAPKKRNTSAALPAAATATATAKTATSTKTKTQRTSTLRVNPRCSRRLLPQAPRKAERLRPISSGEIARGARGTGRAFTLLLLLLMRLLLTREARGIMISGEVASGRGRIGCEVLAAILLLLRHIMAWHGISIDQSVDRSFCFD
jgi:hypothetical protein